MSVHPHLRGAYGAAWPARCGGCGSSPPTWGILSSTGGLSSAPRFIPTYVGHTFYHVKCSANRFGSSPPTWGILSVAACISLRPRFIPTYVGHTSHPLPHRQEFSVHPHLRGAYNRVGPGTAYSIGSSPPTWGIRWPCPAGTPGPGSSPPTWGIRTRAWGRTAHFTVHPHLRGAYTGPP